jgi:hypothetical protein
MKTWWSVAEACVWVATRDLEAVAAVPPGATLSQLGPLGRTAGKGALPSVLAVAEVLPDLCGRGEIDIQGRQILKADTKPIPADRRFSAHPEIQTAKGQRPRAHDPLLRVEARCGVKGLSVEAKVRRLQGKLKDSR